MLATQSMTLLDLPPEVLAIILVKLSPVALANFSQSCQAVHTHVNSLGDYLWKELFLTLWDDPTTADKAIMAIRAPEFCVSVTDKPTFRWRDQVQQRTAADIFLAKFGQSYDASSDEMSARRFTSLATLLSILATTPPASPALARSRNMAWVDRVIGPSALAPEYFMKHFLHDADLKQPLTRVRQLTAKLQVHYLTARHLVPPDRLQLARLNARAYVYNIHHYRPEGWHGPWVLEDGVMEPNWVHLAACQRVVLANLAQRRMIGHLYPVPPLGAEAAWGGGARAVITGRKVNPAGVNKEGIVDWAGVEGVWRRLVCFMDYRDFHQYNYHGQRTSGGLDTSVFRQKLFNEATRLITMTLRITHSEPGEPPFEHRPRLHFEGLSVANDTMISRVHGFVCMTSSGYVRWHLITRYDNDDRWVTEAVQIGDAGSGAGFIGTWTGNNHDIDDPAGPTWLWKVADVSEIPKDDALKAMNHSMFGFSEVFMGEDEDEDDEDEEYNEEDDEEMIDGDEDSDGTGSTDSEQSDSDEGTTFPPAPALVPITSLYELD